MNWMTKIGGRKFWMGLITIAAAMYCELRNPNGLGVNMATFLGAVLATFSASNYLSTASYERQKGGGSSSNDEVLDRIDTLSQQVRDGNDPEKVREIVNILANTLQTVKEVENVSRQVGTGVVNLSQQVQELKRLK